jgi:2-polyprenyl-3-methyl-5-hydroxy-6-metoxy-1,4-benzoquinol methylase
MTGLRDPAPYDSGMARIEADPADATQLAAPEISPVVVTGMHRSGTSLVARLLYDCGLALGVKSDLLPANADNTEGFWENVRFVEVNDALLAELGGAWDVPPELPAGWERSDELDSIRERALELVHSFEGLESWGWKDPRTSLTLPFWRGFLPGARVVVLVRHPLEVARSLESRASSSRAFALSLWERYNRALLDALGDLPALVTHYDAYFHDPEAELRRLLAFARLAPPEQTVIAAATRVNQFARHHRTLDGQLPEATAELYAELCARAGPVYAQAADALAQIETTERDEPSEPEPMAPVRGQGSATLKYTRLDETPGSTHMHVLELVPSGSRVLEIGAATGYMSEALRAKGCSVTAIEVDPEAAAKAERFCERVIVADVETLDLDSELGDETFDVVLFAEVLEHLRDPAAVLGRVRPFVAEGGTIVASIPNVAHGSVRLALLEGEFRYRRLGILDDTHLRFFTRATIEDLFEANGFSILRWIRQHADLAETEIELGAIPEGLRERLEDDPDAATYQFIVQATPSDAAHRLAATRKVLDEIRAELDELRPIKPKMKVQAVELEAAVRELERLRQEMAALRKAHEVRGQRLIAERAAFAEAVAYVQATVYGSTSWRVTAPLRKLNGLARRIRGR